jgi:Protein of unknown function (DUF2934)
MCGYERMNTVGALYKNARQLPTRVLNMKSPLDVAAASRHGFTADTPQLGFPAATTATGSTDPPGSAQAADDELKKTRRYRIAALAYSIAEARGFEAGKDEEDWLRAEAEVDAQDAGRSQL